MPNTIFFSVHFPFNHTLLTNVKWIGTKYCVQGRARRNRQRGEDETEQKKKYIFIQHTAHDFNIVMWVFRFFSLFFLLVSCALLSSIGTPPVYSMYYHIACCCSEFGIGIRNVCRIGRRHGIARFAILSVSSLCYRVAPMCANTYFHFLLRLPLWIGWYIKNIVDVLSDWCTLHTHTETTNTVIREMRDAHVYDVFVYCRQIALTRSESTCAQ